MSEQPLHDHNSTKRSVAVELEKILYKKLPALDYGFIRVIDYMGNDNAIVQAARVSYGSGTKKTSQDKALINYLVKHKHTSPLEMCEIKIHVKLPIFIARQWIRHRTANVNEYSARYSILDKEFYVPQPEHIMPQSSSNKQGRESQAIADSEIASVLYTLKSDALGCYNNYTKLLNHTASGAIINKHKLGIARELARMNLTINYYTQWYWKIDLHNLIHFILLRIDEHAQYEIRVYAQILLDIVKKWVPNTYEAIVEHRIKSKTFSNTQLEAIRKIIDIKKITQQKSGLSTREWNELKTILDQK